MNATESQTITINLDDLILARDVLTYQKEYFRMIAEAKKTGHPEKYAEAKRHLSDCKAIEKTWEKRLSQILSTQSI